MRYEKELLPGLVVYHIQGEITAGAGSEDLIMDLLASQRAEHRRFLLDLQGTQYVNSSGIRILLRARQLANTEGGELALVNVHKQVARILSDIRVLDMFPQYNSIEEAQKLSV